MKKCPKCKAEIQEEARFCLYCMTSFEEKQTIETPQDNTKRRLMIIAAAFVLVCMVIGIVLFAQKDRPHNEDKDPSANSSFSSDLEASADDNIPSEDGPNNEENNSSTNSSFYNDSNASAVGSKTSSKQQTDKSQDNKTSAPTSSHQTHASSKNKSSTTNSSVNTITNKSTESSRSQNGITNSITANSTSINSTPSSNKTENESSIAGSSTSAATIPSQTATVTYICRDAKYGDDFSANANLENAVVITGVNASAADGKYIIPETIDGKKVVAIMASAFCDNSISNTVKTVVVPSSVKTIWNYAFANCYNLTDIYFKGNSIYTESYAFPEASKRNGTLTIHCSANCSDRNFRYYKNNASAYDAEYEEWNG